MSGKVYWTELETAFFEWCIENAVVESLLAENCCG
jgi:hypothetical protein